MPNRLVAAPMANSSFLSRAARFQDRTSDCTALAPWADTDRWCFIIGRPSSRSRPNWNRYGCLCLDKTKIQKHFISLERVSAGRQFGADLTGKRVLESSARRIWITQFEALPSRWPLPYSRDYLLPSRFAHSPD